VTADFRIGPRNMTSNFLGPIDWNQRSHKYKFLYITQLSYKRMYHCYTASAINFVNNSIRRNGFQGFDKKTKGKWPLSVSFHVCSLFMFWTFFSVLTARICVQDNGSFFLSRSLSFFSNGPVDMFRISNYLEGRKSQMCTICHLCLVFCEFGRPEKSTENT